MLLYTPGHIHITIPCSASGFKALAQNVTIHRHTICNNTRTSRAVSVENLSYCMRQGSIVRLAPIQGPIVRWAPKKGLLVRKTYYAVGTNDLPYGWRQYTDQSYGRPQGPTVQFAPIQGPIVRWAPIKGSMTVVPKNERSLVQWRGKDVMYNTYEIKSSISSCSELVG